jgi:formate-dependent nitrite reductase cytochrome c552 subunit
MRSNKLILVLAAAALFAAGSSSAQNKYVGVKKCAMCHDKSAKGNTFAVWEKSPHAKAFETLKSKEAEEIAKKKGLKKSAAESPECLKCHVPGGGAVAGVTNTEGVTCEGCHGPASAYLMVHNKKGNEAKAKEAGLVQSADNGKTCEKCHNSESPTFKGFDFKKMWPKVEHKLTSK